MIVRIFMLFCIATALLSSESAADDATAFQDSCAHCHPVATALAPKIKGTNAEERKANLTVFLKSHHAPDPDLTDEIIAYLLALAEK
jgi:hypothetical protein